MRIPHESIYSFNNRQHPYRLLLFVRISREENNDAEQRKVDFIFRIQCKITI